MALLNFSAPFPVSPPFFTQHGYHYPRPQEPFTSEDVTQPPPLTPPTYTRVQSGGGSKTRIHAVIDYDDDYYDDGNPDSQAVAPLQGPILLKNGTVPVVPLYSYPQVNNGTFVQIPILWTALSLALGVELRGNLIRGVPCYKKDFQLYCPTAGNTYPIDRIELFIDENKALMKRMYGEFSMNPPDFGSGPPGTKSKRSVKPGVPDLHASPGPDPAFEGGETMFGKNRDVRQNFNFRNKSESGRVDACESKKEVVAPLWLNNTGGLLRAVVNVGGFEQSISQEVCSKSQTRRCMDDCGCEQSYKYIRLLSYDPTNDCRGIFMDWFMVKSCCVCRCNATVDACESKVEVITPFWASNSAGKVRAIVNTQHFEQAIHQEVCSKARTSRCQGDCGCEQKYKWYRLLAYDPDNDCRGIFMDWFLFPSCCVCRCNPT